MALAGDEDNVPCCFAMLRWLLRIWIQLPAPLRYAYLRLHYGHYGVGMAALIHDERGRILVVHRTYSRDEPWALPGGSLEGGDEALERGLERELLEETRLRVRVGSIKAVDRHGFAVVLLLEAELLDPTTNFRASAEVSEVAWLEPTVGRLSHLNTRLRNSVVGCSACTSRSPATPFGGQRHVHSWRLEASEWCRPVSSPLPWYRCW